VNRATAEGSTILRRLVGSTVHGLNVNDGIEDRDEMGVCVEPLGAAPLDELNGRRTESASRLHEMDPTA